MATDQRISPECTKRVIGDVEATNAGLNSLKLDRDNCARPDQHKSNVDEQGYHDQTPMQDKEVSAFLYKPSLARLI